jgi:hypothetical protein
LPKGKIDTFPPYKLRNCDIVVTGDTDLREIGIPLDGKIIETPGHTGTPFPSCLMTVIV